MEGQPKQHKHQKPHHPHHVVPPHETGYTDEAAEECHDLIDRAEEEAHVGSPYSPTLNQFKHVDNTFSSMTPAPCTRPSP